MPPKGYLKKSPPGINAVLLLYGTLLHMPYTLAFLLMPFVPPGSSVVVAISATVVELGVVSLLAARGFLFSHNGVIYHHRRRTRYGLSRLTDVRTGESIYVDDLRKYGLKHGYFALALAPFILSLFFYLMF